VDGIEESDSDASDSDIATVDMEECGEERSTDAELVEVDAEEEMEVEPMKSEDEDTDTDEGKDEEDKEDGSSKDHVLSALPSCDNVHGDAGWG